MDINFSDDLNENAVFEIRGDTSAVLLAIAERAVVTQLQRAQCAANHRALADPNLFPSVSVADFELQDVMFSFLYDYHLTEHGLLPSYEKRAILDAAMSQFMVMLGDNIVRRLAYIAGITKMENDLYPLVWAAFLHITSMLLRDGCIELDDRTPPRDTVCKQVVDTTKGETMRDIPPFPRMYSDGVHVIHTIVPGQVERAAERLGISCKVAGDYWHYHNDDPNLTDEQRKALITNDILEAENEYYFVTEDTLEEENGEKMLVEATDVI